MKSKFYTITSYTVLDRIKIKDILAKKDYYYYCYFIVDEEDDDPMLIKDSISWLNNQKPNKKVYVLKFRRETSKFAK